MDLNLSNKVALVCGSTQGIGLATAKELALLGANVVLIARNETKLKEVKKTLANKGNQEHHYIKADFNFPPELKLRVAEFISEVSPIHILINNTGGPNGGAIINAKSSEFINAINMHLISYHNLVSICVEGMRKEKYGRIINIISTSVKQPLNGLGVSNTVRGAVASWSKTLANELGENITVNNVLPGATNTIRLKSIIENKANKIGLSSNQVLEDMKNQVPLKRIAEANEIANAVAFLASPAAAYINGINLPVDGGRTKSL